VRFSVERNGLGLHDGVLRSGDGHTYITLVGGNSNTRGGAIGHPKGEWDLVGANGFDPAVPTSQIVLPEWIASALSGAA
jgi:hypothetical protein